MNSPDIHVELVQSETQQDQFLELPWSIYHQDLKWVPPQLDFQRELLFGQTHPFNEKGECQSWLAISGGKVVGRITAILNWWHLEHHQDQTGFFGFFESIDSTDVANMLLDQATRWLAEQGVRRMRGPVQPSIHYEAGMLLSPCQPLFTSAYNPDYYPPLLEKCDLVRVQTMRSYCLHIDILNRLDPKVQRIMDQVTERFKVRFRHFDSQRIEDDLRTYFDFYNRTFFSMWSFTPIPEVEYEYQISFLREIVIPELTVIAEVDDQTIGVAFGVLDYNPILRENDGQFFKHGAERLRREREKLRWGRMFSTHVLPQYERWGVVPAMIMFLAPGVTRFGLEFFETSWVEEDNVLSHQTLMRAGAMPRSEYGFYEKPC